MQGNIVWFACTHDTYTTLGNFSLLEVKGSPESGFLTKLKKNVLQRQRFSSYILDVILLIETFNEQNAYWKHCICSNGNFLISTIVNTSQNEKHLKLRWLVSQNS